MKGKRPKRKVILFLVEGQSEINALKPVISAMYDNIDPNIEVFFPTIVEDGLDTRGDITSKFGVNPDVLEGCIYKLFMKTFFDIEKLMPKDITEVIQIVDLDGAYVPDEHIVYGENPKSENNPYYDASNIITTDVEGIKQRNERKRKNLDYLTSISEISIKMKKPRYSVYFFSSNLDHFLHGDANLSVRDKVSKADKYALHYGDNYSEFASAIEKTPGALVGMSYEESWQYIREGVNSIQRHSNINILLERLKSDAKQTEE